MSSQSLESAIEWLDQRISNDTQTGPELFARLFAAQRELGLVHDERPFCPFLRPYLLTRARYDEIARAAEILALAFERLATCALADEALLSELGLTESETRMARINPGYSRLCVTSRLDAFLSDEGFKFLEYNAESPAGLVDQMLIEKTIFGLPHMREFLDRYPHWLPRPHERLLAALLEAYREWGGEEERPHIAIVDWEGVSTAREFYVLKEFFEGEGYPTIVADPREFVYRDGHLSAGDFRVDIFYKRVIIHEFLQRHDETHPLVRAYAERQVCMANSFRVKLAHKKAGFAILSDPRYEQLFDAEQLAVIRRHIPWTRVVREGRETFDDGEEDLLDLLRRERERFVIKPNDDYGGGGVRIGWETGPSEWDEAIRHALTQPYVVQERAPVRKASLPMFDAQRLSKQEMLVDFDPFLFLNRVEGGLVRLSATSLCNVSSGGGETALLVLED
jgi:glutathionylspermidine synthase